MSWDKVEILSEYIGKVVTISRPNGDLESVLIKNILLDKHNYEIKEILYVENKGAGETCLLKPGKDTVIKPTGELPTIGSVDSHQTIEDLAGDSS